MLQDLTFKGKNLDEALGKAGNFFGVERDQLQYQILEDSTEGEVRIQLTKHPGAAAPAEEQPVEEPEQQHDQPPLQTGYDEPWNSSRPAAHSNMRGRGERRPASRGAWAGDRKADRNRGRNSHWERSKPNLDGLKPVEREAYDFLVDLLRRMRVLIDVHPVLDQSRLIFNLVGPDRGLLLAKKGSLLTAFQYLVNKIFMNRQEAPQKIFIDSQGYRVAREEELRDIALMSAEKVRSTRREYNLSPMNPYERRLIHITLKDHEDVTTISRGEGYIKRVSIIPKSEIREEAEAPGTREQPSDQEH